MMTAIDSVCSDDHQLASQNLQYLIKDVLKVVSYPLGTHHVVGCLGSDV
jgi:hypothetical protein